MTNSTTPATPTRFAVDNRWSPGNSGIDFADTPSANVAYAGRWIDYGTFADVVPDRHGFAFDDPADRDFLADLLTRAEIHRNLPGAPGDGKVHEIALDDFRGVAVLSRRGGYVYVDAVGYVPKGLARDSTFDEVD